MTAGGRGVYMDMFMTVDMVVIDGWLWYIITLRRQRGKVIGCICQYIRECVMSL